MDSAYDPSDVIAIQYHLHSAAPDPLANPDAIARYAIDCKAHAPVALFNGRRKAEGWVEADHAIRKYHQYQGAIGEARKGDKGAEIDLKAKRDGDVVTITATARALGEPAGPLRLRFALVEDEVLYEAADGWKRHRNLVRATPGGVDGVAMDGGAGRFEGVVNIDDLRRSLHEYLADYPRSIAFADAFRGVLPLIQMNRMSVVAYVRDAEGNVLDAVRVAVPERAE